jgi:GTP diphosphokinase / guanosine-3',5'-bis(diphosphate) 3'-diphosphatase
MELQTDNITKVITPKEVEAKNFCPTNPGEYLLDLIAVYNPDFDRKFVQKAIDFAVKYHGGQLRQSGDPYYHHPIEVAQILAEFKLDISSIVTALLHDTVEDTTATLDMIKKEFGPEIAYIVNGVTKLEKINFRTESEKQAENFRKFLLAISEDIRVLFVKLADRLHNMRTLHHIKKDHKRHRIAKETMEIYAPLAERIGMHKIKVELQDISFGELYPDAHDSVMKRLEYLREQDSNIVERTVKTLNDEFAKAGLKAEISGREKMPFSIWLKMNKKNIGFESVTDIIAFRVIVDNMDDCYRALGVIHRKYKLVPGLFDDYISVPKANGYQSIHTIVLNEDTQRIEIQIRTREMHEIAEYGVAAHWSYKQGLSYNIDGSQYQWVRQLLEIMESSSDPEELLENTRLEMYHDHVFCFTPNGDLIVLPKGATSVDFAFAVHTQVGRTCVGAKVNGRVVPLRTKLKNGDQVSIIQAKVISIQASWDSFVRTAKAKAEIRRYIRQQRHGEYSVLGKSIINQIFLQNDKELDEKFLETHLEPFKKKTLAEFYSAVGEGSISRSEVLKQLFPQASLAKKEIVDGKYQGNEGHEIALQGLSEGMSVVYASCCNPLPGERIVGIQTTSGVMVHTSDCGELENHVDEPERWIDLKWDDKNQEGYYRSRLDVKVRNAKGSLGEIAKICADANSNIYNVRIRSRDSDYFRMILDLEVHSITHLHQVKQAIKASSIVHAVKRYKG